MTESGSQFGKYELLDLLGEGGMARVFRALQTGPMGFRKEVALKLIREHVSREEKFVQALINEARLGGNLHHKNIVETYEFGEHDGTQYIAMELVRGHTLHQVLRQVPRHGALPPRVVLEIATQLCDGLAYAHAATDVHGAPMNLVHRDLKPPNVIVSLDGVIKIMDFGIARADTNLFQTTTGMTKGTPIYMSPEQVKKRSDRPLTHRSDLFSLATVITEMVTGDVVFQGTELYEVLHKIAHAETEAQVAKVGDRVPELVPVLECPFKLDPADRFADAHQMKRALEDIVPLLPDARELTHWLPRWMEEKAARPVTQTTEVPPSNLANVGVARGHRSGEVNSTDVTIPGDDPPSRKALWFTVMGGMGVLGLIAALALLAGPWLRAPSGGEAAETGEPPVTAVAFVDEHEPREVLPAARTVVDQRELEPAAVVERVEHETVTKEIEHETVTDEIEHELVTDEIEHETVKEGLDPEPVDAAIRRPVVSIASHPKVLGGLSADEVTRPLAMALSSFEACYAAELSLDENLAGTMTQIFVVGADGRVLETNVEASTLSDTDVASCFSRVIAGMDFPPPDDGEIVVVEYGFGLSSEPGQ